jgi:hypothetical protein
MKVGDRFTHNGSTFEIVEINENMNGSEVRCDEISRKVKSDWRFFPKSFVERLLK